MTYHFDPPFPELLNRAREIAERVLEPRANLTDQADSPPADNIRRLAEAGLLALTTPPRFGGHGAPGAVVREYTEILAAACGVTSFTQGQHISACAMLAGSENESLKCDLLSRMAAGEVLCGVAFSHLRRPGPPMMRVERDGDSFVFSGSAPWFTGWPVLNHVVLAGTLPDGLYLYTIVPITQDDSIHASEPLRLCAMNATGTVTLTCRNLRVGPERVMRTVTRDQMAANDLGAILGITAQTFGVTTASIRLVRSLAQSRKSPLLASAADALDQELAAARRRVDEWRDRIDAEGYKENALAARAWCVDLGVRAAHAAVTAGGGVSNLRDNTAQRLFREAMFYTLVAQTRDVQAAIIERIAEVAARNAREVGKPRAT